MFSNLKAEMARNTITMADLSIDTKLGLSYESIRNKFLGKTEWTRKEMWHIKKEYFPDKTIEYLFQIN